MAKRGKYNKHSIEKIEQAIAQIERKEISVKGASKAYNIPRTTLIGYLKKISTGNPAGRKPSLPKTVENAIVEKVLYASKAGFPITKRQLMYKVGRVVKSMKFKTQFKNMPSTEFWRSLKKRHPELTIRAPEACASNRMTAMKPEVVGSYFHCLKETTTRLGIGDKPDVIWNLDETGFQFTHKPSKVIAQRGTKTLHGRTSNTKENVTVLACINANGEKMPPFCIVKGKTVKSVQSFAVNDAPQNTVWSFQQNAWMEDVLGTEWFLNVFLKYCGQERPQLLILDSHSSHETVELLHLARKENIHILALPAHTTQDSSHWTKWFSAHSKRRMQQHALSTCLRKDKDLSTKPHGHAFSILPGRPP